MGFRPERGPEQRTHQSPEAYKDKAKGKRQKAKVSTSNERPARTRRTTLLPFTFCLLP